MSSGPYGLIFSCIFHKYVNPSGTNYTTASKSDKLRSGLEKKAGRESTFGQKEMSTSLQAGSSLFLVQIWSIPVILASLLVEESATK